MAQQERNIFPDKKNSSWLGRQGETQWYVKKMADCWLSFKKKIKSYFYLTSGRKINSR